MTFKFQGRSGVSWRSWTFTETNHQQNDRKHWQNLRTHPQRRLLNNPRAQRHRWDELWSLPDLTENLNMSCIAAKFVPWLLTNDQKQQHVNICLELWKKANEDPTFISWIITGDKNWIYGYDPETKQQLSQWKSPEIPRAKKARQVQSSTKSMLIFFSMWRELLTMNLFLLTLRSNLTFTVMFWDAWENMCVHEKTGTWMQPQPAPSQ
jgi:hypothetical protein